MTKTILVGLFVTLFAKKVNCEAYENKPQHVQVSEHFYVSTEQRSFVGALIACKTGGMELASIENEEEQEEIRNVTSTAQYYSEDGYWIAGASERYSSDSWYWVDTGLRMIYTNWGTHQPRYNSNSEYNSCVKLGSFFKVEQPDKWENANCNLLLYYICKSIKKSQ